MATAEIASYADHIKSLGDSIVKLTVLEAKALGDYLEDVHGIKAAAVAAGPPPPGRRGRGHPPGRPPGEPGRRPPPRPPPSPPPPPRPPPRSRRRPSSTS